jgi:outer membrane protein assembly factor BamB
MDEVEGHDEKAATEAGQRRQRLTRRALLAGGAAAVVGGGAWWGLSGTGRRPAPVPEPAPSPVLQLGSGGGPTPLWQRAVERYPQQPTVLADGVLYRFGETVTAIDAATGSVKWSDPIGLGMTAAAANGMVFAQNSNAVTAYQASNGKRRWNLQDPTRGKFYNPVHVLAADDHAVYAYVAETSQDADQLSQSLLALSPSTGARLWSQPVARTDYPTSALVADGRLYYIDGQANLKALDTRDGRQLWSASTGATESTSRDPLAVSDGHVYCRAGTTSFQALSLADGKQQWVVQFPAQRLSGFSQLTAANGVLYGGDGDGTTVFAWSAKDGTQLWQCPVPTGTSSFCPMVVAGGLLFIADITGKYGVMAVDIATGKVRWTFRVDPATLPEVPQWWLNTDGERLFVTVASTVFALPID